MWEIDDHSPFSSAGTFQRDHEARSLWGVWLRAGFELRDDRPPLFATRQEPVRTGPVYVEDDPSQPLIADADVCLPKPGVDLVIHADGYAPSGQHARPFPVAVGLGGWSHQLQVLPPLVWHRGEPVLDRSATPGPVPLDWSTAWGGPGVDRNPLGVGAYDGKREAEGQPLPRLVAADARPEREMDPVSFAPVPPSWPQRRALGGTYDGVWQRKRAPLLPSDLDPRHWQAAPPQLVLERNGTMRAISQGTPLILRNVTSKGQTQTLLPDLSFDMAVRFRGAWHQVSPELQSIQLDLRAGTLAMVYGMAFPIRAAQFDVFVDSTYIALKRGRNFTVAAADAPRFGPGQIAHGTGDAA